MKRHIPLALFLAAFAIPSAPAQRMANIALPEALQAPHIRQLTSFGERCDWSHDGKRLIFLEKTFGDVYEVELATGHLKPLTHHFFHHGFLRALYLANGDILLCGAKEFDPADPWKSRFPHAYMSVLKRDLSGPPVPLDEPCKEGPAVSRTRMTIAWAIGDDLFIGNIVEKDGKPVLADKKLVVTPADLPEPVKGWKTEAQNFRPPHEKELLFNGHAPSIKYEAEVMGLDLETGEFTNYSQRPDRYDEPEGVFPDGRHILVESSRHQPEPAEGKLIAPVDIYKLALDGSGRMERLTRFTDGPYSATNPVISDDGRFMAFQYSARGEVSGTGHGILIWDFEKEAAAKESLPQP